MFKKVEQSQQAFLKMGLFGFQGSGKTWTATEVAMGLHRYIGSKKGVVFVDTETGSDFMVPRFKAVGIDLFVDKTRAFKDLIKDIDSAPRVADIVIVDSITHFWREFMASYMEANRRKFLRIQDWGPLKEGWAEFTKRFVNAPVHIIMCGRAANVFDDVIEDEEADENGVRKQNWKAVKVGTKMSAEGETGYEPSLLVEMEKVFLTGKSGKYARRANVIKERFGIIDSHTFDFVKPGMAFEAFLPHIKLLNIGGEHIGFDESRSSRDLFDNEGDWEAARRRKAKEIAIEEIEGLFGRYLAGQDAKSKKLRLEVFNAVCGTTSWTAIRGLSLEETVTARGTFERLLLKIEASSDSIPDPSEYGAWLQELIAALSHGGSDSKTIEQIAAASPPSLTSDGEHVGEPVVAG